MTNRTGGLGRVEATAPERRRLADYSHEEQQNPEIMTYPMLLKLRREAYREHIEAMDSAGALRAWGAKMAERYGPAVKVHHNALEWPSALMVARYGEEPVPHWPTSLSEADRARARQWLEKGPAEFSPGMRQLGTTVTLVPGEHLFGLEEIEGLTVVRPMTAAAPAAEAEGALGKAEGGNVRGSSGGAS